MKNSKKIQLKAMNHALYDYASKEAERAELSTSKVNTIKQTTSIKFPYNSMEVIKSGQIYTTIKKSANNITEKIKELKIKR